MGREEHTGWAAYAPVALAVVGLALVPLVLGGSRTYMGLATSVLVVAGYATALNVIFGLTGQLFLCVGALGGVSGYAVAITTDQLGWPLALGLAVGVVLATALGAAFSWVAVRRSLDAIFTGILTLTSSLAFENLLLGQRGRTGGETGLVVAAGAGTPLGGRISAYLTMLLVVGGFLALFRWVQRSTLGWGFRALRADQVGAALAGVDVLRHRVAAGAIGSAMIGLVGALHALHEGFIAPSTYAFAVVDIRTIVVLALGGVATLLGPLVGAVCVGLLDEALRGLGQLRVAVHGVLLVALFLGLRGGLVPTVAAVHHRLRRQEAACSGTPTSPR